MQYPYFQVNAFSSRAFHGNPAAVVPIDGQWPDDAMLLGMALEHNLSETAFVRPSADGAADFDLRWFTPAVEVNLCGHATLATAHVLRQHLGFAKDRATFSTRSGVLAAWFEADRIVLDLPARPGEPTDVTESMVEALNGLRPSEAWLAEKLMCVFENKRAVHEAAPDFAKLMKLPGLGMIITAPGAGHDFVSRFFAPKAGVNEDPVTGSAHCTLVPYWAGRLGKTTLTAHQVSPRGGELSCTLDGERVHVAGRARTYLTGTIELGDR